LAALRAQMPPREMMRGRRRALSSAHTSSNCGALVPRGQRSAPTSERQRTQRKRAGLYEKLLTAKQLRIRQMTLSCANWGYVYA
jgi:hypothetical protein